MEAKKTNDRVKQRRERKFREEREIEHRRQQLEGELQDLKKRLDELYEDEY